MRYLRVLTTSVLQDGRQSILEGERFIIRISVGEEILPKPKQ